MPDATSFELPDEQSSCRLPSPLGFVARYCVYGRADAATNVGDTSKPYGSGSTPLTVRR